jgi:nitrogen fixation protein FixH
VTATTTARSSYRWFPWAIAATMAVIVAVNLVLTYFAFSSSTGLVTKHPFDEGNGYNAILQAAARQDALGWNAKLALAPSAHDGRGELVVTFSDRGNIPLTGLNVTAHLERPVEPIPEEILPLREAGAGHYAASAEIGHAGQWDVRIVARRGDDLYEFSERIFVK